MCWQRGRRREQRATIGCVGVAWLCDDVESMVATVAQAVSRECDCEMCKFGLGRGVVVRVAQGLRLT